MFTDIDAVDLTRYRYFQHFHPYLPIIRQRDPNKCYDACPLLFWTIVFIASRRYARGVSTFSFMLEAIKKEMFSAISIFPLSLQHINAFILICTWSFPDSRFIRDPTCLFSSAAMNGILLSGVHQGKWRHTEFNLGQVQNEFSDEEATFTWASYNIVSQR